VDHPVFGSWSATRWQYVSRERPERVVDVVTGLGGSVTLSLSGDTYVLTWEIAGQPSHSVGGTLGVHGDRLELLPRDAGAVDTVAFHAAGDTLSLSSSASAWEFDGGGEEPADFVAVLVRL
jgi:hypothetical protein